MSTLHDWLNHSISWHLKLGEIRRHSFHVFQLPVNKIWARGYVEAVFSYTLQFPSQSQDQQGTHHVALEDEIIDTPLV